MTLILNPAWRPSGTTSAPSRSLAFHRSMPGYAPTPLVTLGTPAPAARLVVKNEQSRFGLPAYKVLGGSWALHEAIRRRLGLADDVVLPLPTLREHARSLGSVTLTTATDGNHGRGIAFMASQLGVACVVFIPRDMVAEREAAIAGHGARVVRVDGGYDVAVEAAGALARETGAWLCADTAGDDPDAPDHRFARDVQDGYHTLFAELLDTLGDPPGLLVVPAGVGALTASAIAYFRARGTAVPVVTAEPSGSACVQASIAAGTPTPVPDTFSIMAGLRSAHISMAAWPLMRDGVRGAVDVSDDEAIAAIRELAAAGVEAGESGAASLAAWRQLAGTPQGCDALGATGKVVAVINTEGATDRQAWARYTQP